MKTTYSQFQVILFGNFEDIAPKPDTLKYFIEQFADKEVIPTTRQEIDFSKPGVITNRVGLVSNDGLWSIDFGKNRIEIQKNSPDVDTMLIGEIQEFIKEAKKIVKVINTRFPKKFNRFALISASLTPKLASSDITKLFNKINSPIKLFEDKEIVEWNNRAVARHITGIKVEEIFNLIADISRIKSDTMPNFKVDNSKDDKLDRIELKFDINTHQGTTDYRFDLSELKKFLDVACKLENQMKQEYSKILNID